MATGTSILGQAILGQEILGFVPAPSSPAGPVGKGWLEAWRNRAWTESAAQRGRVWTEARGSLWIFRLFPESLVDLMAQQQIKHTFESYPFYIDLSQHGLLTGVPVGPPDALTGTPTFTQFVNGAAVTDLTFSGQAIQGDLLVVNIAGGVDGTTYQIKAQCGTTGGKTVGGIGRLLVSDAY